MLCYVYTGRGKTIDTTSYIITIAKLVGTIKDQIANGDPCPDGTSPEILRIIL